MLGARDQRSRVSIGAARSIFVQPRVPRLAAWVGVRVALTRQKLRQEELFRKSPGHRVAIVNNGLCAVRVHPLR